ncbi:MAG: hypothetical protein B0D87_02690, partial [Candidatus Sedimenticola endophacoides]
MGVAMSGPLVDDETLRVSVGFEPDSASGEVSLDQVKLFGFIELPVHDPVFLSDVAALGQPPAAGYEAVAAGVDAISPLVEEPVPEEEAMPSRSAPPPA